MEHACLDVVPIGLVQLVAGQGLVDLAVTFLAQYSVRRSMSLKQVVDGANEKTPGAACGIGNQVAWLRVQHAHHEIDDVTRRPKLAVDAGRSELRKEILVVVALAVAGGQRQ